MVKHIYNTPVIMIFLENKHQTIECIQVNKKKTVRDKTYLKENENKSNTSER